MGDWFALFSCWGLAPTRCSPSALSTRTRRPLVEGVTVESLNTTLSPQNLIAATHNVVLVWNPASYDLRALIVQDHPTTQVRRTGATSLTNVALSHVDSLLYA